MEKEEEEEEDVYIYTAVANVEPTVYMCPHSLETPRGSVDTCVIH
jgi:hypothetical protein